MFFIVPAGNSNSGALDIAGKISLVKKNNYYSLAEAGGAKYI
jgi:hypothetical protein